MDNLFSLLHSAKVASQQALDTKGRSQYPILASVSKNVDPEDKRRIKVSDAAIPGLDSDWLRRLPLFPGFDPPLPKIGDTVFVFYADGDPTNGWYLSCNNLTNPPHDKESAIEDLSLTVPGNTELRIDKKIHVSFGESFELTSDSGVSIQIDEQGAINISAKSIAFTGLTSASLNGKQIATVGAPDSGGDILTGRGW